MTSCDVCGNGSQEELWTTSMSVDTDGKTTWIQVGRLLAEGVYCRKSLLKYSPLGVSVGRVVW